MLTYQLQGSNTDKQHNNTTFSILMFPWLAHGHISPFLNLANNILNHKNFRVYFCSTAINFDSINTFIRDNFMSDSIELVQLHLESTPSLPPHYHTTKNLPSDQVSALIQAFQASYSSFSDIVSTLSPDLVIYDLFQPWAAKIASSQGIPAVHFATVGAMALSFTHHLYTFGEHRGFPFPTIQLEDAEMNSLDAAFEFLYDNIFDIDDDQFYFGNFKHSHDIVLIKTTRGLEGKYIDYLSALCYKKLVPVGPLVRDDHKNDGESSEIIDWLDNKGRHSTVFISFGSEHFLSKAENDEVAKALELCDINFIWIIRSPVGVTIDLEEALPQGFLNRVRNRGIVVTRWAPQAKILSHPNTGGFLSHCGWSSVTESTYFGIPVIAMPMKVDQPLNARMLAEAGACVKVQGNINEGYKGEEIDKAMREVFYGESGERMRHRAQELSEMMRAEKEQVLDDAAKQLWQICLRQRLKNILCWKQGRDHLCKQGRVFRAAPFL